MKYGEQRSDSSGPPKGLRLKAMVSSAKRFAKDNLGLEGSCVASGGLRVLAGKAVKWMGLPKTMGAIVEASLESVVPPMEEWDIHHIAKFAIRLLANRGYLDRGEVIPPWDRSPVWTALFFSGVKDVDMADGRKIVKVYMTALTGLPAGTELETVVSWKAASWIAKELGFPRFEKAHRRDLVGMVGFTLVDGSASVRIEKIAPSSSQKTANRKLAKARLEKDCPRVKISCVECPEIISRCPLATRRE